MTLAARVQNYSLVASTRSRTIHFYLEDPRQGGERIGSGTIPPMNAREAVVVTADADWIVPDSVTPDSLIWAQIEEHGLEPEIRLENNLAWNFLNPPTAVYPDCWNGIDDDGDGDIDYPADLNCADAFDLTEVPEPAVHVALLAGVLLLSSMRSRRA